MSEVPVATGISTPDFPSSTTGIRGAVTVQGREAHMVARQTESTRPLVPGTPYVAWQTHQRRRKRNALHAIPQIHPSSGRHTDIVTSAPPSASTPAHCSVIFQPWRRLTRKSMKASSLCAVGWESTFTAAPRDGALADAFYTGANKPQPDRRRYIWPRPISTALFFSVVSPLVSHHVAKCEQDDFHLLY